MIFCNRIEPRAVQFIFDVLRISAACALCRQLGLSERNDSDEEYTHRIIILGPYSVCGATAEDYQVVYMGTMLMLAAAIIIEPHLQSKPIHADFGMNKIEEPPHHGPYIMHSRSGLIAAEPNVRIFNKSIDWRWLSEYFDCSKCMRTYCELWWEICWQHHRCICCSQKTNASSICTNNRKTKKYPRAEYVHVSPRTGRAHKQSTSRIFSFFTSLALLSSPWQ